MGCGGSGGVVGGWWCLGESIKVRGIIVIDGCGLTLGAVVWVRRCSRPELTPELPV